MSKPKIITKGNLEYRPRKHNGGYEYEPVLVRCPVCGEEFNKGMHRKTHLSNHSPEDFGL